MTVVRTASCPGCGGTLQFQSAATLCVVCPFCGGASYRSDVALEFLGKVAEVAPIDSPLELGTSGRLGARTWTAVGQVQLDHGAGPWNEWCLLLDDGSFAWLAEAQGELLVTTAVDGKGASLPSWDEASPGVGFQLAGKTWVVAERGDAR